MSLENQLQAEESNTLRKYNLRPMSSRERPNRRLQEMLDKRPTLNTPVNINEEYEEQKKQNFQLQSPSFRQHDPNQINTLTFSHKMPLERNSLLESPLSTKNNFISAVKNLGKNMEGENEFNGPYEDSIDLPAYNHEYMKSTIYSPMQKSPLKKASIPLIRPILETRENAIQKVKK